ncbi:hypothetical protein ANN_03847 [Periplaneta americana]|uniref:Transposase Tc1-like domain-containing protein n=1 Tax=Periplaneta americana TaxID=6978 RepID=A0ABQ8U028_PERAM|nr:hypothetical protein ANN_03847 [Periplaneta americana]
MHARRPGRIPPLNCHRRAARFRWAIEHQRWQQERWSFVLFTDETRICLRVRIWRVSGYAARARHPVEYYRQGGGSVFWADIMHGLQTPLVRLIGNVIAMKCCREIVQSLVILYLVEILSFKMTMPSYEEDT